MSYDPERPACSFTPTVIPSKDITRRNRLVRRRRALLLRVKVIEIRMAALITGRRP